jgi:serine kinase of HPr protein (carbohydrate metabolism regulator)
MHASGVKYDSKGFIFSGVSGIGKTTMSNFWLDRGGDLINDDRLMLMHDGNGFLMYNTPMAYKQEVKCSPVSAIFLLKKSPDNKSIRLTKGFALARIISHCIQHSHDKKLMDSLVENASKLIENVPVYELGFKPDVSVVDYIRNLEF